MQVTELIELMHSCNDETALELYHDLLRSALKYSTFRFQWELYTVEERSQNDAYRTSAHNAFMDNLNILLRYLNKVSVNVPSIPKDWNRKELGDFACRLVCEIGIRNR